MKNTIQLNVRIDGKLRNGHRLVAAVSQESVGGLTEAALKFFYGSKDPEVMEMRRKAMAAAEDLKKGIKSVYFPR